MTQAQQQLCKRQWWCEHDHDSKSDGWLAVSNKDVGEVHEVLVGSKLMLKSVNDGLVDAQICE